MSGVGTHEGLTHRKRLRGGYEDQAADDELEALIVDLYTDGTGRTPRTWRQRRNLIAAVWWLVAVLHAEDGDEFRRSWPQIIRGIGGRLDWDIAGRDVEELKRTYEARTKLIFGYMRDMGIIDGWEAVEKGRPGEFAGIRFWASREARSLLHRQLELRAAQLRNKSNIQSRRRPRRPGMAAPPVRKAREIGAPSGESERVRENFSCSPRYETSSKAVPAGRAFGEAMQQPTVDANAPSGTATGGAALVPLRTAARRAVLRASLDGSNVPRDLRLIRELLTQASADGAPSHAVAIVAWEAMRWVTGHSKNVRIHPNRWRSGKAALDICDRYGAFGAGRPPAAGQPAPGVLLLLDLMEESAMSNWKPLPITSRHPDREAELNRRAAGTVVSLSHFLCAVGQIGRHWREQARARAGYKGERKGRRRGTKRARRRRGRACR